MACGLKGGGETDVGVIACDVEEVSSALALTRNAAAAAPIRVCRDECDAAAIRAVAVNSGNANAATGEQGYRDALAMRDAAAEALGVEPRTVAVAETGTIGVPLDVEAVTTGVLEAVQGLSATGGEEFARSIMTTDSGPKQCTIRAAGRDRLRPGKGRRDDRAGLRDDALLRPDRRRRRTAGRWSCAPPSPTRWSGSPSTAR